MGAGASRSVSDIGSDQASQKLRAELRAAQLERDKAQDEARRLQAQLDEARQELKRMREGAAAGGPDAAPVQPAQTAAATATAHLDSAPHVSSQANDGTEATTLLPRVSDPRALSQLPPVIQDLHGGMPPELAAAPMRLMSIAAVVAWGGGIKVYEDVAPADCMEVPYADVTEAQWAATVVLSWRWGAPKPASAQPGFSPMRPEQFEQLAAALTRLAAAGFTYTWIDWCCVPQYSAPSMVEVLRSKVFYARARAMLVVPTFHSLPAEGIVRPLLARTHQLLRDQQQQQQQHMPATAAAPGLADTSGADAAAAAEAVGALLSKGHMACREYLSRVWTLAERLARYGRAEPLSCWLGLEAWLGMLADAVLAAAGVAHACHGEGRNSAAAAAADAKATAGLYRKILLAAPPPPPEGAAGSAAAGGDAGMLLDELEALLSAASGTGSLLGSGAQGLDVQFAALLRLGTRVWRAAQLEEAPSEAWLLGYLGDMQAGVYQAWSDADRVWAVYSYFCWKNADVTSLASLAEAVKDLVSVAGGGAEHVAAAGSKLGLGARRLAAIADVMGLQGLRETEAARAQELGGLLHGPAAAGDVEEVKRLLAAGAEPDHKDEGSTALATAALNGHTAVVLSLLDVGADTEATDTDGNTPLLRVAAAGTGRRSVVEALLAAGADKEAKDKDLRTPLIRAAMNGHLEVVEALVAAGADKEAKGKDTNTPLLWAATDNHKEVLEALLAAGADKEVKGKLGVNAMLWAATLGCHGSVEALLAAGADMEVKAWDGSTPLIKAAERGHGAVVAALLAAGADMQAADRDGRTALAAAEKEGHAEVVAALVAAGAERPVVAEAAEADTEAEAAN